jgi:membrane-associated protein
MIDIMTPILQITTDPLSFFQFFGYWGLALILFGETGLFGFFLPGDSLLLTLGLIASQGHIDISVLIPILMLATMLGDSFSYFLGRKFSEFVKRNIQKIYLEESHLEKAHEFYAKHGGKTIVFCKFIAFVRTFAPFVAGTSKMNYFNFLIYDFIGTLIWVGGIVGGSYYLGKSFHFDIKSYFHYFIFFLGFLLLSPFVVKIVKKFKKQ